MSALMAGSPFLESSFPPLKRDRMIRFILNLALQMKLLVLDPQESVASVSPTAEKWLSNPLRTQLLELGAAWFASSWDELYQIPNLRIDVSGRRNAPKEARATVVSEMATLAEETWYSLDSTIDSIYKRRPNFLRPASDPYNFSITIISPGEGHQLRSEESEESFWHNLEGSLIRNYIYDPLYWLGLVRLGLSDQGRLTHFSIAKGGLSILMQKATRKPKSPKRTFVLQPDFEITADREFDRGALFFLGKFSKRIQTDAVLKFHLTKQSIAHALQRGIDTNTILSFLKRHAMGRVPQNVEFSIKEWAAKFGNIRIREAVILETADEFLMSELFASRKVAPQLLERVGDRTALIEPEQISSLQSILKKEGYLPELQNALGKNGPDVQSYSLTQQQSLALFAGALAASKILSSLDVQAASLKRFLLDEELLLQKTTFKLALRALFLAGEMRDVALEPEMLARRSASKKKPAQLLISRPLKGIKDKLASAHALKSPVVIEYLSPITETFRFLKMTVSEIIKTANGGFIRGKDHHSDESRVIPIAAIKSVSALD